MEPEHDWKNTAKWIAVAVAAALILIVFIQNIQSVETRILFVRINMPHAATLIVALSLGVGIGMLLSRVRQRRNHGE